MPIYTIAITLLFLVGTSGCPKAQLQTASSGAFLKCKGTSDGVDTDYCGYECSDGRRYAACVPKADCSANAQAFCGETNAKSCFGTTASDFCTGCWKAKIDSEAICPGNQALPDGVKLSSPLAFYESFLECNPASRTATFCGIKCGDDRNYALCSINFPTCQKSGDQFCNGSSPKSDVTACNESNFTKFCSTCWSAGLGYSEDCL